MSHHNILVSLSGGSDSDIMLDLIMKTLEDYNEPLDKFHFVFFDTGLEYKATKKHLDDLERKYGIVIKRERATVPIPIGCKKYGLPFISKDISSKLNSLQNNDFDFANDGNKEFEFLLNKYPKCQSVIKWWCNKKDGFNISQNKWLKEFLILNPPDFKISSRCCEGAKKKPSKMYEKEYNIDLKCMGLRKSEGGIRLSKFKTCFDIHNDAYDNFRPIWWFSDTDKQEYKNFFEITYSDCYEEWGFKRTGCAGCPFNSNFETDLIQIKKYEPSLYVAINNIFKKSYDYTRKFKEFKNKMNIKQKTEKQHKISVL